MNNCKRKIITFVIVVFSLWMNIGIKALTEEFQRDTENSRGGPYFAVVSDQTVWDAMESLALRPDGTFIAAGHAWSRDDGRPISMFMKYDNSGNLSWAKTVGLGFMADLTLTPDNGYCLAGQTREYGFGESDFLVMKYNSTDELIWAHTIGGQDGESVSFIEVTSDGGLIMAGDTMSYGAGASDFMVVRCNSSGEVIWATAAGGSGSSNCRSACITEDGSCVVVGETLGFGVGSFDLFIVKFGSQGQIHWSRTVGTRDSDSCYDTVATSDGGVLVVGGFSIGAAQDDFLVIKYNASGTIEWARGLGEDRRDTCFSVMSTSDGGIVIGGSVYYQNAEHGMIAKLNGSGELIWSQLVGCNIPGDDLIFTLNETIDGDILLGGRTDDYSSQGHAWLFARTNSQGFIEDCPMFQPFPALIQDVADELDVTIPAVVASDLTLSAVDVTESLELLTVSPDVHQFCLFEPVPTATPMITPTPTATPKDGVMLTIDCPDETLNAGDPCYLDINITNVNIDPITNVPLFCLMEVSGMYWYYPTWTVDIAWETLNSIESGLETISIFPEFPWPEDAGSGSVMFWGVLTDSQLTRILGVIDTKTLSWE